MGQLPREEAVQASGTHKEEEHGGQLEFPRQAE